MPACVQPGTRRGFEPPLRTATGRRRAQFPAVLASIALGPWSPAATFRLIFVSPAAVAFVGFVSAAAQDASVSETGLASWYGPKFTGRPTASGETYNPTYLTAAHRSLPFGSLVHVQNLDNQRDMVVRINDRGPFVRGRILDLSQAAAEVLGFRDRGVARVRITRVQARSPSPPAAAKAPANATPAAPTAVPAAAAGQAHEDGAAAPPDTMATPADPAAFGLAKPDFSVESIPTKSAPGPATTAENTQPSRTAAGAPQSIPGAAPAAAPNLASTPTPAPPTPSPANTPAPKTAAVAAPKGEAPVSTRTAPAAGTGDFYVQIGAFRDAPGAKEHAESAGHLGVPLRTEFTGGWYRVLAGPYARRDQANQVRAEFARSGIEGFVRTFAPEDFESPPVGSR